MAAPVGLGKPGDHRGEARRQLGLCRMVGVGPGLGREVHVEGIRAPVAALTRPQRITQGVAGNLEEPCFRTIARTKRAKVPYDPQEHVLEQIIRLDARRHASGQERPKGRRELGPNRLGGVQ